MIYITKVFKILINAFESVAQIHGARRAVVTSIEKCNPKLYFAPLLHLKWLAPPIRIQVFKYLTCLKISNNNNSITTHDYLLYLNFDK